MLGRLGEDVGPFTRETQRSEHGYEVAYRHLASNRSNGQGHHQPDPARLAGEEGETGGEDCCLDYQGGGVLRGPKPRARARARGPWSRRSTIVHRTELVLQDYHKLTGFGHREGGGSRLDGRSHLVFPPGRSVMTRITPRTVPRMRGPQRAWDQAARGGSDRWGTWWGMIPVDLDTTPPVWPDAAQLMVTSVGEDQVSLSWPAASDNVGLADYQVVQDGLTVANTAATTYTATGLVLGATYAFAIEATDPEGNQTTDGPSVAITTAYDFPDTEGSIFEDDVAWMSGAGITQGCTAPPDVLYCPGDPVTRAQMATFLVRALNLPAAAVSPFLESMNPQGHLP